MEMRAEGAEIVGLGSQGIVERPEDDVVSSSDGALLTLTDCVDICRMEEDLSRLKVLLASALRNQGDIDFALEFSRARIDQVFSALADNAF